MTRDAYGYGNNNPVLYADPSGLAASRDPDCGGDRECAGMAPGGRGSVWGDDGSYYGTIRQSQPTSPGQWFPKDVQDSLYDLAPSYSALGQLGRLNQSQLIAFAYLQQLKNAGILQVGPNGGLQGPTDDTRYLAFLVDYLAVDVLGIQTFMHAKGAGPFDGCGWSCATGTIVMGLAAFTLASGGCVVSVGWLCGVSMFAASGATSVTYEALSNPGAKGGQLACAFFFGPSNPAANAVSYVYGAGTATLTKGASAIVGSIRQDLFFEAAGVGIGC